MEPIEFAPLSRVQPYVVPVVCALSFMCTKPEWELTYQWAPVEQGSGLGTRAPENAGVSIYATLIEELQARAEASMVEVPDEALQSFDAWESWLGDFKS